MKVNKWREVYDSPQSVDPWKNVPDFALYLDVEPTNHCNMKCAFCNRKRMTRPLGYMLPETFSRILEDAIIFRPKGIRFLRWGEPLWNYATPEYIRKIKDAGMLTHVTTNGLLLSGRIGGLKGCGLDTMIVSMQGTDATGYRRLRGNKQADVIAGIHDFKNSIPDTWLVVSTTITNESPEQVAEFVSTWSAVADEVSVGKTMFRRVRDREGIEDLIQESPELPKSFKCKEIETKLSVQWDGTISACCIDYDNQMTLGNVHKNNLMDSWESPERKAMLEILRLKRLDLLLLCSECELNYEFRGEV